MTNFTPITLTEIQQNLRKEIKSSHLKQKEIAEKLGVSPQTISKYMKCNKFPALDTFANLCVIIGASADEILGIRHY